MSTTEESLERVPYRPNCSLCTYFARHDQQQPSASAHPSIYQPSHLPRHETDAVWDLLREAVAQIISNPSFLDHRDYISLYNTIYNFSSRPADTGGGAAHHYAHEFLEFLYLRLDETLTAYVEGVKEVLALEGDDGALLDFYGETWRKFREGARVNASLFSSVHRGWVEKRFERSIGALGIEGLHFMRWKKGLGVDGEDSVVRAALRRAEGKRDVTA
ncbi:ubiquitin ligase (cullin) of SCF [Saxophila tyrrhenica]|uniref:Ubiquitin ligase (Cullin) of SCF n=1 Tax=Saxophila tyrrhenica TaxID=1690608 RepID=A0AAV9PQN7_9PEZI|nr:ubiquitin ligase (cullin) of SCF [Saxophila tyrrhenica]